MDNNIEVLRRMYDSFNTRDIDGVLAHLADDVTWANGMDGGYVHGHEAVREYWTRQWTMVSPLVEPKQFKKATDDAIIVYVQQSVRDLEGKPLQDQTHGLQDKLVGHIFHFQEGKVVRFDIQDVSSQV
jgi:ketosteroid isomerase-like protein